MNKTQNKVYKITYGSNEISTDARRKDFAPTDNYNVDSINVIGTDVYDALQKSEKYTLRMEKLWLKDDMQLFVESVELLCAIDEVEII